MNFEVLYCNTQSSVRLVSSNYLQGKIKLQKDNAALTFTWREKITYSKLHATTRDYAVVSHSDVHQLNTFTFIAR